MHEKMRRPFVNKKLISSSRLKIHSVSWLSMAFADDQLYFFSPCFDKQVKQV